jgi:cytochrome c-type biogenesis protein CcmI
MIPTILVMLLLLVSAGGLLVIPTLRRDYSSGARTRDSLNIQFYQRRLAELAHDERQGIISARARHIDELQQALLADNPVMQPKAPHATNLWVLLPGIVGLAVVTLGCYAWTGSLAQVWRWQQTVDQLPDLRARLLAHDRQLTPPELANFAVGLRASLERHPADRDDWLILGRIGVMTKNDAMATQAYERARRLAPHDQAILLDYAAALTQSADPGDNLTGNQLLNTLVQRQPNNIAALSLFAISQYQQNNFAEAIILWRRLLTLLPATDAHVAVINRSIAQAREQSGQGRANISKR